MFSHIEGFLWRPLKNNMEALSWGREGWLGRGYWGKVSAGCPQGSLWRSGQELPTYPEQGVGLRGVGWGVGLRGWLGGAPSPHTFPMSLVTLATTSRTCHCHDYQGQESSSSCMTSSATPAQPGRTPWSVVTALYGLPTYNPCAVYTGLDANRETMVCGPVKGGVVGWRPWPEIPRWRPWLAVSRTSEEFTPVFTGLSAFPTCPRRALPCAVSSQVLSCWKIQFRQ